MKFPAGDPLFAGWDVGAPFTSGFPDESIISAGQVSKYFERKASANSDFVSRDVDNYTRLTRSMVGRELVATGLPAAQIDAATAIFELGLQVSIGAGVDWKRVAETLGKTLGATLKNLNKAMADTITGVPIIGWIIDIGLALYRLIRNAVVMWRALEPEDRPPATLELLAYDKARDSEVVNDLLARVIQRDWTPYFLPPSVPRDLADITVNPAKYEKGWPGETIRIVGGDLTDGDGFVPGLNQMRSDWLQFPTAPSAGGGFLAFKVESAGAFLPSCLQFSTTAWQACSTPSSAMFKLDPGKITRAWEDYYELLDAYRDTAGLSDQARTALAMYTRWATKVGPQQTWFSRVDNAYPYADVPSVYKVGPPLWSNLIDFIMDEWVKRLQPALRTVNCAYVDGSFATIKWAKRHDRKTYSYWLEMRKRLLLHRARANVDVTMIPDDEYKREMIQAKRTIADVSARPGIPGLAVAPATGAAAPGRRPPGIDDGESEGERQRGDGMVLGAAIVGGLVLAFLSRKMVA